MYVTMYLGGHYMKKLLLALSITLLASCGAIDALSKRCGNGTGCKFMFGKTDKDQNEKLSDLQGQINRLKLELSLVEGKVSSLEIQDSNILSQLSLIDMNLAYLDSNDDNLQNQIDAINVSLTGNINSVLSLQSSQLAQDLLLTSLQVQIDALGSTDASLQAQIDSLDSRLDSLEGNTFQQQIDDLITAMANLTLSLDDAIVEYLDPCSDAPGYDEVLLRTASGKVIAYFEDGNGQGNQRRHLTVLIPNTLYGTTDSTGCNFQVDVNGNLI